MFHILQLATVVTLERQKIRVVPIWQL